MVVPPLIQVDNFAAFANLEVDGALARLLAQTREQLTCFAQALRRHKDLQAVACLLVGSSVVRDPGTLKGTFQRVASKRIPNERQEGTPLAPADFRPIVAMRRNTGDDQHAFASADEPQQSLAWYHIQYREQDQRRWRGRMRLGE